MILLITLKFKKKKNLDSFVQTTEKINTYVEDTKVSLNSKPMIHSKRCIDVPGIVFTKLLKNILNLTHCKTYSLQILVIDSLLVLYLDSGKN